MRLTVSCDCGQKYDCKNCVIKEVLVSVLRPYIAFGVVDFIKCSLVKKEENDKK